MNLKSRVRKSIVELGVIRMTPANVVIDSIALIRQELRQLESQLNDLQSRCDHQFTNKTTHQQCERCQFVESFHY